MESDLPLSPLGMTLAVLAAALIILCSHVAWQ